MKPLSFETARQVNSVDEEYDYLEKLFGKTSFQLLQQKVLQRGACSYDVLRINSAVYGKEEYYFDISSFSLSIKYVFEV